MRERAWFELIYSNGKPHARPGMVEMTETGAVLCGIVFDRARTGIVEKVRVTLRDEPLIADVLSAGGPSLVASGDRFHLDSGNVPYGAFRTRPGHAG